MTDTTPNLPASPPPDDLDTPRPPRRRSGLWKWVLLVVILILVGVGIYFARPDTQDPRAGGRQGGGGNRPMPVVAEPAKTADVNVYLSALGTVTSLNSVVVRPRVDGILMRVHFREGQTVRSGDVLAEIDPRPYQ